MRCPFSKCLEFSFCRCLSSSSDNVVLLFAVPYRVALLYLLAGIRSNIGSNRGAMTATERVDSTNSYDFYRYLPSFKVPAVERIYAEQVEKLIRGRLNMASVLAAFFFMLGVLNFSRGNEIAAQSVFRGSHFLLIVLLRWVPKSYLELAVCICQAQVSLSLLMINTLRLKRQSFIDRVPPTGYNLAWSGCGLQGDIYHLSGGSGRVEGGDRIYEWPFGHV